MDKDYHDLIQAIHASPQQLVYVAAGAGTQALADLLGVGGASRTMLEAVVPYNTAAFDDFLGQAPGQYVASETARLLAGRAYTRARWLVDETTALVGLSCTASIASDRPKRGEHRAYIASWTPKRVLTYAVHLTKDARTRQAEEALISKIIINALAHTLSLPASLPVALLPSDRLETKAYDFMEIAEKLATRNLDYFAIEEHGRIRTTDAQPQMILSGSFNPLHKGHLEMARAAYQLFKRPVAFELSAFNVDKPPIPPPVILERIAQFAGRDTIYVSNAPTYVEKARLYPGATFVIGYDTAVRLFVSRYYNNSEREMWAALDEIRTRGSAFLVAGRVGDGGAFHSLGEIDVPKQYSSLFNELPESLFRNDISSSLLRRTQTKGTR